MRTVSAENGPREFSASFVFGSLRLRISCDGRGEARTQLSQIHHREIGEIREGYHREIGEIREGYHREIGEIREASYAERIAARRAALGRERHPPEMSEKKNGALREGHSFPTGDAHDQAAFGRCARLEGS
jgi:hypothetical protein